MNIKFGMLALTLLLALNGNALGDLIGDSMGGSIAGFNSMNIITQFTTPEIVGPQIEFTGSASNYFTAYGWMNWDIDVDISGSSFQVTIDDPNHAWDQNVWHASGLIEIILLDLDWIGTPGSFIQNVSLISFSRDYVETWTPEFTIMSLTHGLDNITLRLHGIADNDIYNFDIDFAGTTDNPVPEPSTILLLGVGLIGLAGAGKKFLK